MITRLWFSRFVRTRTLWCLAGFACVVICGVPRASAESPRKAAELIGQQEPAVISARVMELIRPDNSRILVSISKQRAYLMLGDEVAIDTPVSTGKRAGMTPPGEFTVMEKDPDHRSNIYGNFVDGKGRMVRSGVSTRIDSAPSGSRFSGAPMYHFLRLNEQGLGLHAGHLPGYPASHGCIRLPVDIAPLFFKNVKTGTPAKIVE